MIVYLNVINKLYVDFRSSHRQSTLNLESSNYLASVNQKSQENGKQANGKKGEVNNGYEMGSAPNRY